MDIRKAILPRYADIVNVRSHNDGNRAPAFNGGNIDGGVANFDNGAWRPSGVSNNGGERAATPVVVIAAAAGRGGMEAPAGGKNI
jgi:hypothetical protein